MVILFTYLHTLVDLQDKIEVSEDDQETFINFMSWIDNYNTYILMSGMMKTKKDISDSDKNVVDNFIDVTD